MANAEHSVHSCLLRNSGDHAARSSVNTGTTYIPMKRSCMYLQTVIDWYHRYAVAWQLSNPLKGRLCLGALVC